MKLLFIGSIITVITLFKGKNPPQKQWTPPPPKWIKYNTDAAKNRKTNITAASFVCKNATNMNMAIARWIGDIDILIVKVLTIREAVIHARKK